MKELGTAQTRRKGVRVSVFLAIVGLGACLSSSGADSDAEATRLTLLVRQLDVLERLARQSANESAGERSRYYFDYDRLNADIERIRGGIQSYLSPHRAQPRDSVPLVGDYSRHADGSP